MKILSLISLAVIAALFVAFLIQVVIGMWKEDREYREWRESGHTPLWLLAIISMLVMGAVVAKGQTNAPPPPPTPAFNFNLNFLTNLPTKSDFTKASAGFSTAVLLKSGNIENENKFDKYFGTNWVISLAEQNTASASVIDNVSLYGGYRIAWPNAEIMVEAFGRRNWTTANSSTPPSWQGGLNFESYMLPTDGGKFMIGFGCALETSPTGGVFKKQLQAEFGPRLKLIF